MSRLVLLAVVGFALAPVASSAQAPSRPQAPPLERRPYAIRAQLAFDPSARIDPNGRKLLIAAWSGLVQRFVGAPWKLEIVPASGRFDADIPDALAVEDFKAEAEGLDALWVIRVSAAEQGGLRLSGRAYDTLTATLGPVVLRDAPYPSDLPRALFGLALDLFVPIAEVGPSSGGGVALTVQGAALAAADPVGDVVRAGSVFIPIRLLFKTDGSLARIVPVGWSYLKVDSLDGPVARCAIISSLRDPLSRRVAGKWRLVALGIKPAPQPMTFRFETRPPNPRPAAGYTLTVRDAPDGPPRIAGTTDRAGRITIPARFAQNLVILRLLAGGVEPLVEFPAMPGETAEERVIRVNTLTQAVALETRLNALRDEIVDLVAVRARLEARLKARADGNAWDEVKPLLDEYHKLPSRQTYVDRLEAIKNEGARQQDQLKVPVLTRTAQALIEDTEALIGRYLDDEIFQAYERGYGEAQGVGLAAPSTDWKPFAPAGAGFRILMPGSPTRSTRPLETGTGRTFSHFYMSGFKGTAYGVGVSEPAPGAAPLAPDAILKTLERDRDNLVRNLAGAQLVSQRTLNENGLSGLELKVELPTKGAGGSPQYQRMRTFLLPSGRAVVALCVGPKATVEGREGETFLNSLQISKPPAAAAAAAVSASAPTGGGEPERSASPAPKTKAQAPASGLSPF